MYTVIGGSGFVGSELTNLLKADGFPIWVPDKYDHTVFERDLGIVFYCAGLTSDYITRPFDTIDAHVTLLAQLLKISNFTQLIYLSSTRIYDNIHGNSQHSTVPVKADLIVNPHQKRHLYDISKLLGENLCINYSNGKCCVCRLSCVVDLYRLRGGFLPNLVRLARNSIKLTINSHPDQSRDYILIDDVVRALRLISDHPLAPVINVSSGVTIDNKTLAATLSHLGKNVEFNFSKDDIPTVSPTLDITSLIRLGIKPRDVLDEFRSAVVQ